MTTWAPADFDELSVFYTDFDGQKKHTKVRVASGASDGDIEALIAKMQAASDLSIQAYNRIKANVGSGYPAANEYNSSTHPYAQLTEELRCIFTCGPQEVNTRSTIFGPKPTNLQKGDNNTIVLNPSSATFTDLEAAAQAVQVNTKGTAVATLEKAVLGTTKASG